MSDNEDVSQAQTGKGGMRGRSPVGATASSRGRKWTAPDTAEPRRGDRRRMANMPPLRDY